MDRPSFTGVLKHANSFTVKNLGTFLPLTLKTILLCIGFGVCSILLVALIDTSLGIVTGLNPAFIVLGVIFIIPALIGIFLTINPLLVSLYRRALLDEEVDRNYLKRIFAKRELNFLIAGLKVFGVFFVLLALVGGLGGALFLLASSIQSMVFNVIAAVVGGLVGLALSYSLFARLAFVFSNVVLDLGSNLKTSIAQSQGFTLLLIGVSVSVMLLSQGAPMVLNALSSLIIEHFSENLAITFLVSTITLVISLFISYFALIFSAAAICHIYKFAVMEKKT